MATSAAVMDCPPPRTVAADGLVQEGCNVAGTRCSTRFDARRVAMLFEMSDALVLPYDALQAQPGTLADRLVPHQCEPPHPPKPRQLNPTSKSLRETQTRKCAMIKRIVIFTAITGSLAFGPMGLSLANTGTGNPAKVGEKGAERLIVIAASLPKKCPPEKSSKKPKC
jgi:hypothetical protein